MSFTRRDSVRWFDIPNLRLTEMDSTGFSGGGGGGATDLDGLSDVTISAASSGQVLKHDGSGFTNSSLGTSDLSDFSSAVNSAADSRIAAANLEDLSNVPALGSNGTVLTISSGAPAWEAIPRFPFSGMSLLSTTSQNINASATNNLVLWNSQQTSWGSDIFHRTTSDLHKITFLTDGVYELSASVAFDAQSSGAARYNGIARFRLNGTTDFGPEGKGGYIRDATGHDESSVHIQTFPYSFSSGDYIWLKIDRESSVTGRIDTTPYASALYVRRIY